MKILIYGINYTPELTGIGKYSGEMGNWLSHRGHEVTAVTTFPYYPNWKIQPPYKNRWWKKEQLSENETVIRCPFYVPKEVTSVKRILHEFSFLFTSSLALCSLLFKKVDVIVNVVTPFHLGIAARLFARLKGVPMIYHIQDLQVDAAKELGMINNKTLLNTMEKVEKWILNRSTKVSTISEGMRKKVEAKGINSEKILFFPNWVDTTFIKPYTKEDSLIQELRFDENDYIVLYSGNLGEKQGLEYIIETAKNLLAFESIKFVIVGEGGVKDQLVKLVADYGLPNVYFFPLQPYEQLPRLLAMADLHLVLQRKAAADLVMPSKLTTILAAGGCAIITAEAETTLYKIAKKYNFGIVIPAENTDKLKEAILNAYEKGVERYKINARQYSEQFLEKEAILKNFEKELIALTFN